MASRDLTAAQVQALAERVNTYNDDSFYTDKGFMTRSIHVGQKPDPVTGAVMLPITLSSTFAQTGPGELYPSGYDYSRAGNPTRDALEKVIASLEHGKHGLCFSSGLAATMAVLQTFDSGLHVLCSDDVYGGTNRLFRRIGSVVSKLRTSFVDMTQLSLVEAALTANPDVKLVWLETPTNPTLKVCDIAAVAALPTRLAPSWWPTTRLPRRTFSGRWIWAPILYCTRPPSTWAATRMWCRAC
jgi:cystathionine gamma-lyase